VFHFALAVLAFSLFVAVFLFAILFFYIWRFFENRKKRRRLRLESYEKRLKAIVAELLVDSNEIESASHYVGLNQDEKWNKGYHDALAKLLGASERLADCKTFREAGELEATQETIWLVTRAVYQVQVQFQILRPKEAKVKVVAPEPPKQSVLPLDNLPNQSIDRQSEPMVAEDSGEVLSDGFTIKINSQSKKKIEER
jgi:hypothetical protein